MYRWVHTAPAPRSPPSWWSWLPWKPQISQSMLR
jgi:hypothetical protein